MIRFPLLLAAAIASSIGTTSVFAHERGWSGGYAPGYWRPHYAPRYWAAPVRPFGYYDPYWVYPGPARVYSYPLYEPAPLVIERTYEPLRYYEARRVEPAEPYEERSYAQVTPAPQPRPVAPPAPRMERYTLSAKELFAFDKAVLRSPQPKLDEIAAAMKRNPRIEAVTIRGYTDRLGSDAYNRKLSQRRADAVKAYLVAHGVAASRLTAIGEGEANPVVQCTNARRAELIRCLEPNRRVEVEQITLEREAR